MPFILPPEGRRKTQSRIGECHGSNGIPPDRRASARHASSSATDQAETGSITQGKCPRALLPPLPGSARCVRFPFRVPGLLEIL